MKQIVSILALVLAPAIFAGPRQELASDAPSQAGNHGNDSTSSKATSHDRHTRKRSARNHHHRHRTTAKNHTS